MDKLKAMQTFVEVVDTRSFSRAAEAVNLSAAAVTAIIQNLEKSLKTKLLHRTTRSLSLTADGAAYYERSLRILAEIGDIERAMSGTFAPPQGKLRVELPRTISRAIIIPSLGKFQENYSDIELMLESRDDMVNVVPDGADCIIGIDMPEDSLCVTQHLGFFEWVTVASPDYLRKFGEPKTTEDLANHYAVNFLTGYGNHTSSLNFVVETKETSIQVNSKLATNDIDAYLDCCLKGFGLVQVPKMLALPHLLNGDLLTIMHSWSPRALPISIAYPRHRHLSSSVRAFAEWVLGLFRLRTALTKTEELTHGHAPWKRHSENIRTRSNLR